jgi:hypothetical protein
MDSIILALAALGLGCIAGGSMGDAFSDLTKAVIIILTLVLWGVYIGINIPV